MRGIQASVESRSTLSVQSTSAVSVQSTSAVSVQSTSAVSVQPARAESVGEIFIVLKYKTVLKLAWKLMFRALHFPRLRQCCLLLQKESSPRNLIGRAVYLAVKPERGELQVAPVSEIMAFPVSVHLKLSRVCISKCIAFRFASCPQGGVDSVSSLKLLSECWSGRRAFFNFGHRPKGENWDRWRKFQSGRKLFENSSTTEQLLWIPSFI